MHVKKVIKKDRYGNQITTEYEVPEKSIDPTRLMEKRMELDQPDMEISMMSMPVGGEEFNMGDPMNHPGEPKGQDTVPAWLTPGEFVVNAEAMSVPGMAQQVEEINNIGRAMKEGGAVYREDGGWLSGLTDFANQYILGPKTQIGGVPAPEEPIAMPMPRPTIDEMEGTSVPNMPVPIDPTTAILHAREGYRPEVYLDSVGKPTVGYGHLLPDEYKDMVGQTPFSEEELSKMFEQDKAKAIQAARENVGEDVYNGLNRQQQMALNSMAFQLGAGGQRKFKKMLEAIKKGDHSAVAREALTGSKGGKSKWYKQTPTRAMDLAMAFDPDMAAQYKNAGGVVYKSDGGWGSWLKNTANKYVLGDKTQIPTVEMPYGWNTGEGRPATREEGIGMGTVPVAPISQMHGAAQDIPTPETKAIDQLYERAQGGDEYAAQILADNQVDPETGLDMSPSQIAEAQISESPDYMAMVGRAESAGVIPPTPEEYIEMHTATEDGQTPAERGYLMPGSSGTQLGELAANEAFVEATAEGKSMDEAKAEADAAREAAGGEVSKPDKPTKDEAASRLDALITETPGEEDTGPGADQPGDNNDETTVNQAGENEANNNPAAMNETKGMLQEVFGDLFSGKELLKTAVMYLGSRALGYSHNGSLRWAAQKHLAGAEGRQAAKAAAVAKREANAFELAKSGKYSPESVEAYRRTGNLSALAGGQQRTATGKTMSRTINGKRVVFQEVKSADGNVMYVGPDGQAHYAAAIEQNSQPYEAAFEKGTPEYRARRSRATSDAAGRFEEVFKNQDTFRTGSGHNTQVHHHTDIRPKQAADEFWAFAEKHGLDPESDEALTIMTNAYQAAIADGQNSDKVKPSRLTPYLEGEMIREKIGDATLMTVNQKAVDEGKERPRYVRQDKMNELDGNVDALVAVSPVEGLTSSQVYSEMQAAWSGLDPSERARYNNSADEGVTSGFYVFVNEKLGQLYNQLQSQ